MESIAVDSAGNAYVTGYTTSSNFPTKNAYNNTHGGGTDCFVFKLSASGDSLLYSTFVGGSASDRGASIAVDSAGNAYVTGSTYSSNFPTVNAFDNSYNGGTRDCFVFKLSSLDSDADGLSDYLESQLGTDRFDNDTDDDLLPDGWEVQHGFDPLDPIDASQDADMDGLTNLQEYDLGTDPLDSDSDNDGMSDGWEAQFGFDPTNPEVPPTELLVYYTPSIAGVAIAIAAAYILKLRIDLYYEKKQLMKEAERAEKTREALEELELDSSRQSKRDNDS